MRSLIINNNIINTPLIKIIKEIKRQARGNKLKTIEDDPENIRVTCPNPDHKGGQESHASCGVYVGDNEKIEYGVTHCFTCGFSCPFYHFTAVCLNCSDEDARQWLVDNYGEGTVSDSFINLPEIDLTSTRKTTKYLDENILKSFQSWHPYLEKRKISRKVAEKFEVKFDPKSNCIVFPVRNEFGKLVMLTRRSVENKKFIIDKGIEKPIYLLNYVEKMNLKEVIVCESQINALTAFSWGYPAIATFGCNVTPKQFEILNKSGILHYYLAFDGDTAGEHGINLFLRSISKSVFVDIIKLPQGKDINDLSLEEFEKLEIISSQDWQKQNL